MTRRYLHPNCQDFSRSWDALETLICLLQGKVAEMPVFVVARGFASEMHPIGF
jgi:hypothetical protein